MLLIIGMLITAAAVTGALRARTPAGRHTAHLGWMSEQWLAEHRATHP
jgi:hypothetical protein